MNELSLLTTVLEVLEVVLRGGTSLALRLGPEVGFLLNQAKARPGLFSKSSAELLSGLEPGLKRKNVSF